jgi:hypothetical protein
LVDKEGRGQIQRINHILYLILETIHMRFRTIKCILAKHINQSTTIISFHYYGH